MGVDTGGTFTDAVVVDLERAEVLSKGKALTTRHDLRLGVEQALRMLEPSLLPACSLVALSTTLATNSIVEGKGAPVALLAAVPEPKTFCWPESLPADERVVVRGAHDRRGQLSVPLDEAAAREAISRVAPTVSAFAISSYFSIYNAELERRLRELVAERCDHPVVCGHELTGEVGMVERATTACLNARLLPTIGELMRAVKAILAKLGIAAPLMVVRGDGSLLNEASALSRPVETVLSGPAASVLGACRLSGLNEALVIDIGGTTSDIAVVRGGRAATCRDGARVGGWQTRVQAVDMWTVGLGGDSKVTADPELGVQVGPRRAIPLCYAAVGAKELEAHLAELAERKEGRTAAEELRLYTLVRRPNLPTSAYEDKLFDALAGRVWSERRIAEEVSPYLRMGRLVELGAIAEVAFTPTDLLHVRGRLALWSAKASMLGAAVLARIAGKRAEELLDDVEREITASLTRNLAGKALHEEPVVAGLWSKSVEAFVAELLARPELSAVATRLAVRLPIVAVGAPAEAYLPPAAAKLGTRAVVPPHAEVANALGAVCARVVERAHAFIRRDLPYGFVVVTSEQRAHRDELPQALELADEWCRAAATRLARDRGATDVDATVAHEVKSVPLQSGGVMIWECVVTATAVGSPIPTERGAP